MKLFLCMLVTLLASVEGSAQTWSNAKQALAVEEFYKAEFYLRENKPKEQGRLFEYNCLLLEAFLLNRQWPDSVNSILQRNLGILQKGPTVDKDLRQYFQYLQAWAFQNSGKSREAYDLLASFTVSNKLLVPLILYKKADLERNLLRKFDDAELHLKQALAIYSKDSAYNYFRIYRARLLLGLVYRDMNDFEKAEKNYRIALSVLDKIPDPKYDERAKVLNNLGNLFRFEYAKAKPLYEESLDIRLKHVKDSASLSLAYGNLGIFYFNFGDYERSKAYYARALAYGKSNVANYYVLVYNYAILLNEFYEHFKSRQLLQSTLKKSEALLPANHINVIRLKLRLIASESYLNNTPGAQTQLLLVRKDLSGYPATDQIWVDYYDCQSMLKFMMKDFPGMKLFNDSAMLCFEKLKNKDPLVKANLLKRNADANLALSNLQAASKAQRELFGHLLTYQSKNSPEVVSSLISLGEINLQDKSYDSAIYFFQDALARSTLATSSDSARTETERLMAHSFLARTFFEKYKGSVKVNDLTTARNHIDQSIAIMRHKKQELRSEIDKINYGQNMFEIFPVATDIYYQQYQINPTTEKAYKIFELMELGKSQLLIRSMMDQKISEFANVTKSVVNYEQKLDEREVELRRDLDLLMAKVEPEKEIFQSFENELNQLKKKKIIFIDSLKKHLPDYYNLKYNQTLVSPAQVQAMLKADPKSAIIIFGSGQEYLYAILFTASGTFVQRGPTMAMVRNNVKSFRNLVRAHAEEPLAVVSESLFTSMIKPFQPELQASGISKLTIVPEDALVSFPFEALISGTKNKGKPLYLLEQFEISYNYSVTLFWQKNTDKQVSNNSGSFVGFAPTFISQNQRDPLETTRAEEGVVNYEQFQFTELPGARQEINSIEATFARKKIPVKTFMGNEATEQAFREVMQFNPQYIHLATHGFTSNDQAGRSGVAFHNDQRKFNDGLLLTEEVYGLNMPADLAVLSACETGLGQYRNGEGVIGLTRAFLYAGVRSIMVSLWKVEDESTAKLMTDFYEERVLRKKSKMGSLRQAKLDLIREGYHPYYWSPFILIGAE